MTLTEFLLARIVEDEREGRMSAAVFEDPQMRAAAERQLRRFMAECEAKRRIVEECQGQGEQGPSAAALADIVLCDLASVYADHPDYREEWTP